MYGELASLTYCDASPSEVTARWMSNVALAKPVMKCDSAFSSFVRIGYDSLTLGSPRITMCTGARRKPSPVIFAVPRTAISISRFCSICFT